MVAAGFTTIDGCETSASMLEKARLMGVDRELWPMTHGLLDLDVGAYSVTTAFGVISPAAAPGCMLKSIANKVGQGGKRVFSFIAHALETVDHVSRFDALLKGGFVALLRESGTHVAGLSSVSTVCVLERSS